jgi:acyl-CoA synthetase (AMP-forming)/AMP-acid ligase II
MIFNFGRTMLLLAQRFGEKEAIVNTERNRRYTFSEYHLLTNRIANLLRFSLKLGKGDYFLLILDNDSMSLLQFPAIFKQEATAVMANLRDSVDEHHRQIQMISPKVVFIESRLLNTHSQMLRDQNCTVVLMDPPSAAEIDLYPEVLSFWDLVEAASDAESEVELDQDTHPALLRFTGGTTGTSKCATYTIDNWFTGRDSVFLNPGLDFNADTRMLHVAPLSHGTQLFMYPTFYAGGTNITVNIPDVEEFRRIIEKERITHSFLVPTALYRLLDLQRAKPRELGSLKTLMYGAAPISVTRLADLVDCFGPVFAQAYAATEVPMVVSCLDKAHHLAKDESAVSKLTSTGNVTPGVEVFITDKEGNVLPAGEVGEIRIRARAVISGYFGNPEATAAEFIDGAWRSGDMGYIDRNGYLFIVDRLKEMIITGGFNVYPAEVEAALATHPAVLNSAVVGLPDVDWGEAVHAEVQLREGLAVDSAVLIAHVKTLLGSYKAPKSIFFTDALPLSAAGKVLRRQVRDKYVKR